MMIVKVRGAIVSVSLIVSAYLMFFSNIVVSGPPTFLKVFALLLSISVTVALIIGVVYLIFEWRG
jgi:hypothetical protein